MFSPPVIIYRHLPVNECLLPAAHEVLNILYSGVGHKLTELDVTLQPVFLLTVDLISSAAGTM